MTPSDALLLFSGGVDSLAAWWVLGQPDTVYVRLGHPYEAKELATIESLAYHWPKVTPRVIDGPPLGVLEHGDGHIPHRNLLLAATAAAHHPHHSHLWLGALRGEASPDKSGRFLRSASRTLSRSEARRVTVSAPLRHFTKTGLVREYLRRGGPPGLLRYTRSCYSPDGPCNRCQACVRRFVAFQLNGLPAGPTPTPRPVSVGYVAGQWRRAGVTATPALAVNNWEAWRAGVRFRFTKGAG